MTLVSSSGLAPSPDWVPINTIVVAARYPPSSLTITGGSLTSVGNAIANVSVTKR